METKVDDLNVDKLKPFPVYLKKLRDVVNKLLKVQKFNTLKTKVNRLDNKLPYATSLIHINQYNIGKTKFGKKMSIKNTRC